MENKNIPNSANLNNTTPAPKPHQKNKLLPVVIILAIVAILGCGFGVYGVIAQSNTQQENTRLSSELTQKQAIIDQVQEALGTEIDLPADTDQDTSTDAPETPQIALKSDPHYIYLGEWGLKIKLPDDFVNVSYQFDGNGLCLAGVKSSSPLQTVPEFADIDQNAPGLACLSRYHKDYQDDFNSPDRATFTDGDYYFIVTASQAVYSRDAAEAALEAESRTAAMNALQKDHISSF